MINLKELSFEPNNFSNNIIKPIKFERGLNLIIGEKSESLKDSVEGRKMNGVGKSILVEAINFCLLKGLADSRISRIPIIDLPENVYICLTIEVETADTIKEITIKRSRDNNRPIIIIKDGSEIDFEKCEDAEKYLESLFFINQIEEKPSLRNMLSILLREEKTSYDEILHPYGKSGLYNFSELLKPHLYLFNFDLALIEKIKKVFTNFDKVEKVLTSIRSDFKREGVNPSEVKAYLNDLEDTVNQLNIAVDQLKPAQGSKQKHKELQALLTQMEKAMEIKAAKDYSINRIKRLPKPENIPVDEIRIIYNKYKEGLGDLVQKSFEQVLSFKNQIEEFQTKLMTDKLKELQSESSKLEEEISVLDEKISKIYSTTDAKKKINDLTETVKLQKEKGSILERVKSRFLMLEEKDAQKKKLKKEKGILLDSLDNTLFEISNNIQKFEEDLKNIHSYIAGNKNCQFSIKVKDDKKEYIYFDYRIKLDGSSGINRIKTFIYDVLLMLNKFTSEKHFGFLIHDNIFASTGKDDMVRALNFLSDEEKNGKVFQYIVTINKDEFDSRISELEFDYSKKTRAILTRDHPFLEKVYSEV